MTGVQTWLFRSSDGLALKHQSGRGYVFLLPVPEFRKGLASLEFGAASGLSIEFLFEDRIVGAFVREEKLPGGGRKPIFPDEKKQEFADATFNLAQADFAGFKPVFALVEQILARAC